MFNEVDRRERRMQQERRAEAALTRGRLVDEAVDAWFAFVYETTLDKLKEAYRSGEESFYTRIDSYLIYSFMALPQYDYHTNRFAGKEIDDEARDAISEALAMKIRRQLKKDGYRVKVHDSVYKHSVRVKF